MNPQTKWRKTYKSQAIVLGRFQSVEIKKFEVYAHLIIGIQNGSIENTAHFI